MKAYNYDNYNEWKHELNYKQINTTTINTINICSGNRAVPPLNRARSPQWKSTTPELRNCHHVLSKWKYYTYSGSNPIA